MFSVAIDGPAGAGKSTIAKTAAKKLGFIYVDTGALYRAVGLACLRKGISTDDKDEITVLIGEISVELVYIDGEQRVLLDGEDVSEKIRTEDVSMAASVVSKIPEVRMFLLELQRGFSRTNDIIMDGRDIGTVVLPGAQVKIFLTASPESRADRRTLQLREKGESVDREAILNDIIKRDYQDTHRKTAPLRAAEDAHIIDTTQLTLEESVEAVMKCIREGMSGK